MGPSIAETTQDPPVVSYSNMCWWFQSERPKVLIKGERCSRNVWSSKDVNGLPSAPWDCTCWCDLSCSHHFWREIQLVLEWTQNSPVGLLWCWKGAASNDKALGVELALVQELYQLQVILRVLHVYSNLEHKVCDDHRPPVPNLGAWLPISIRHGGTESCVTFEGRWLQYYSVQDIRL